jgi:hypothetical protein
MLMKMQSTSSHYTGLGYILALKEGNTCKASRGDEIG